MTDVGLLFIAIALYLGLKAVADAVRERKAIVTIPIAHADQIITDAVLEGGRVS